MIKVRVKEDCIGYYNHMRRRSGNVFSIMSEKEFSPTWMERVPDNTPEITTPIGPIKEGNMPPEPTHSEVFPHSVPTVETPAVDLLKGKANEAITKIRGLKGQSAETFEVLAKAETDGQGRSTVLAVIDAKRMEAVAA